MPFKKDELGRWAIHAVLIGAVIFAYLYAKNVSQMAPANQAKITETKLPAVSPLTLTNMAAATNTWQNAPIVLTGLANETGVVLYWKTNGLSAPLGFKVIEGAERSPVYPLNNYVDLDDSQARTYVWPVVDGQVHYFRVCQSLVNGDCGQYSNNLWLKTKSNQSTNQLVN